MDDKVDVETQKLDHRMDLQSIFRLGIGNNSRLSANLKLKALSLGWRQKYENKPEYILNLDMSGQNDDENGKKEGDHEIKLHIEQVVNGEFSGVGTGAHVWPAAHILAKHLVRRNIMTKSKRGSGFIEDKVVIDVGSGTGVMAIVTAMLGARLSVATDVESTHSLMLRNIERISSQYSIDPARIQAANFDWIGSADHLPRADIILVSDCILPQLYPIEPLVKALDSLLDDENIAIFSYEARTYPHYNPREKFVELLEKYGLYLSRTIPMEEQDQVYCSEEVELFEVRRKL